MAHMDNESEITKGMPREGDDNQFPSILDQELPDAPKSSEREQAPSERNEADERRRERRATFRVKERGIESRERELIEREARQRAFEEFSQRSAPQDVPQEWLTMYGDTPASRQAWQLNEKLFSQREDKLRQELKNDLLKEREQEAAAQRETDNELTEIIAEMEDKYNIDLSSNAPAARKARTMYLDALTAISPKDTDGDPMSFGDPEAAYEMYQFKREKEGSGTRAKEASNRSMGSSGQSNPVKSQDDSMRDYLRANGIKV